MTMAVHAIAQRAERLGRSSRLTAGRDWNRSLGNMVAAVNSTREATLVLVSNYADGWSARINGARTRVYRVNGAFQGACLAGPGRYQVIFEFEPPLWRLGLGCAAAGVLLLVLFRRRPSKAAGHVIPSG